MLEGIVKDEHLAFFPHPGTEKHGLLSTAVHSLDAGGSIPMHMPEALF